MGMNNHIITARDMMENEAVSFAAVMDYVYPYDWMKSLGRAVITTCDMFGHGFLLKFLAMLAKVFMFCLILFFMWVPICLFFRGACFYVASWIRLVNGLGQKESLLKNLWFCGAYTFLLAFAYVPWLVPLFFKAVSWNEIMQYVNLV